MCEDGNRKSKYKEMGCMVKDILQGEGSEKKGLRGVEGKQLEPHL